MQSALQPGEHGRLARFSTGQACFAWLCTVVTASHSTVQYWNAIGTVQEHADWRVQACVIMQVITCTVQLLRSTLATAFMIRDRPVGMLRRY